MELCGKSQCKKLLHLGADPEIAAVREVVKETADDGMQLTHNCKTVKRHLLINKLSSINSAYKIAFIAY